VYVQKVSDDAAVLQMIIHKYPGLSLSYIVRCLHWFGNCPRNSQSSLQFSDIFLNLLQSTPWHFYTSYRISKYIQSWPVCTPFCLISLQSDTWKLTLNIYSYTTEALQGLTFILPLEFQMRCLLTHLYILNTSPWVNLFHTM